RNTATSRYEHRGRGRRASDHRYPRQANAGRARGHAGRGAYRGTGSGAGQRTGNGTDRRCTAFGVDEPCPRVGSLAQSEPTCPARFRPAALIVTEENMTTLATPPTPSAAPLRIAITERA